MAAPPGRRGTLASLVLMVRSRDDYSRELTNLRPSSRLVPPCENLLPRAATGPATAAVAIGRGNSGARRAYFLTSAARRELEIIIMDSSGAR